MMVLHLVFVSAAWDIIMEDGFCFHSWGVFVVEELIPILNDFPTLCNALVS